MGNNAVPADLLEIWPFRQAQPHVRAVDTELEIKRGALLACSHAAGRAFVSRPRSISTRWIRNQVPFAPRISDDRNDSRIQFASAVVDPAAGWAGAGIRRNCGMECQEICDGVSWFVARTLPERLRRSDCRRQRFH